MLVNPFMIVACVVDNNLIWDAHLDGTLLFCKRIQVIACGVDKFP